MEEEGFDYSFPGVHGRRSLFVQGVRKVHELNRHKRMEHMISAYRNAGWMSLILVVTVFFNLNYFSYAFWGIPLRSTSESLKSKKKEKYIS